MKQKIVDYVVRTVEGGVAKDIFDLIEEALEQLKISREEYLSVEVEVLAEIDNNIFTCENCNWTLPIEEMSEDGWMCNDCAE